MDGGMDEWMEGGQMDGWRGGYRDGGGDGWMNGGGMNGWMDR